MEKIGVIGLGRMGSAIAARLASQGFEVAGWTRSGLSDAQAQVLGIRAVADIAALVASCDVIVTSLYDDHAVIDVMEALLAADLEGKLIIETSTARPSNLTERADRIAALGAMVVDAPISGGPEMVSGGSSGVFIGGDDAAAERAMPVVSQFAGRVFHVGPLGAGLVMKVLNNSMIQAYVGALQELLPMAKRAGLSLEVALDILNGGPAGLPMIRDRLAKITGEDTTPGFTIDGVLKDNLVFQAVARSYGVAPNYLEAAADHHREAIEAGLADEDLAVAIGRAYRNA